MIFGNLHIKEIFIQRRMRNLVKIKIFAKIITLLKKISFSLRISSVNVTKSAGNCGFGHIY